MGPVHRRHPQRDGWSCSGKEQDLEGLIPRNPAVQRLAIANRQFVTSICNIVIDDVAAWKRVAWLLQIGGRRFLIAAAYSYLKASIGSSDAALCAG